MPNASVSEVIGSPESWAEVRAHDRVMRYRRMGAGRPVLILHSADEPESLWPELVDTLGAGYRLILPEPPPDDEDVAAWLAGFLEGLGTSSVRIVAAGRFCLPAIEIALLEAVGITRLVLVTGGPATADSRRGFLRSAIARGAVPLLTVRRGHPAGEGVAMVTDFLRQEIAVPA